MVVNGQKDFDDEHRFMALSDEEKWRNVWAILRDIQGRVAENSRQLPAAWLSKLYAALPVCLSALTVYLFWRSIR